MRVTVSPLFWFTDVNLGALGFSPIEMSMLLGTLGITQALWALLAFSPLQKRVGSGAIIKGCISSWPVLFLLPLLLNRLLRMQSAEGKSGFRITLAIFVISISATYMVLAAAQLAINNVSPNSESLSTLNALALTAQCATRIFAPGAAASIFAVGG